ncbi:hypothetical protein VP511E551_P0024 [Vibrio phage 511E55-1]|nr:hypothetical protein VP511E551_P0024 [Vibrio phage 511E55-1]
MAVTLSILLWCYCVFKIKREVVYERKRTICS